MDSDEDRPQPGNQSMHQNLPFDESMQVSDPEEVESTFEPTPRMAGQGASSRQQLQQQQPGQTHLQPPQLQQQQRFTKQSDDHDDDDDDDVETGDESDDDDDDDEDDDTQQIEGAYNPEDYKFVADSHPELSELFDYIKRYTPQHIELDHRLKPFIPDFIPAVGDIDAFIKVPRPDGKENSLGLKVLDEPSATQSDPTVLDLQLRAVGKTLVSKQQQVSKVQNADRNTKAIDKWINSIADLHKHRQPPTVNYSKPMPSIDDLMAEWPAEMEEVLKEVGLPSADLDCDLTTFTDLVCGLLDVPIHKSRVQSLHLLFTLYSTFANSEHFRQLAEDNKLDNRLKQQQQQHHQHHQEPSDYTGFD